MSLSSAEPRRSDAAALPGPNVIFRFIRQNQNAPRFERKGSEAGGQPRRMVTAHLAVLVMLAASPVGAATVRHVAAGGNLQAALDAAQPGDEVVLEAGATFTGRFKLPKKPPGPVITVRISATLPARRIGPADAALMPKIASGSAAPALEGRRRQELEVRRHPVPAQCSRAVQRHLHACRRGQHHVRSSADCRRA